MCILFLVRGGGVRQRDRIIGDQIEECIKTQEEEKRTKEK